MKKIIITLLIIIAVLFAAILAIPVIFKGPLLEKTKATINNEINATAGFSEFNLSLLKSFPRVSIELKDVYIAGIDEFENDTLLKIPSLRSQISLFSLFSPADINIEEVILDRPTLALKVNNNGKANWDISKKADAPQEAAPEKDNAEETGTFKLFLEKVVINNADIIYDDRPIDMVLVFKRANFNLSGNMYGTATELNSTGEVEQFSLTYDSVAYISKTTLKANSILRIDYKPMGIRLIKNELWVNQLPLEISGSIQMPNDSMSFNLEFASKTSGLNDFLALVPPGYSPYLKGLQASGTASLTGFFKGYYFDKNYPALTIALKVGDGRLKYAQLPEEVKNIRADIKVEKPQGSFGLTTVKINEAHSEIKNNPIDLTLALGNLMSDIHFEGALVGKVNFSHLKNALPMDSVDIAGVIDANLRVNGNYSDIENSHYDKITSNGVVFLTGFSYSSPELTQVLKIPRGQLDFSPTEINLSQFDMQIGTSDFNLAGGISNYLGYLFEEGVLKGNLQLKSRFVNLNELMALEAVEKAPPANKENHESEGPQGREATEAKVLAFDIPGNVDMVFSSSIEKAVLDRLPITNVNGLITVKGGKLNLNGLKMEMLDGELKLTGSYKNTPQNQPLFDFAFNILDFNIPYAYRSLTGIRKILPVAGHSQGEFSSNFTMKGQLSPGLKLIAPTIDGNGIFSIRNMQIIDSPTFKQLKGILKKEKLNNVKVDDFSANFSIDKGNLLLKPFRTKVAGQETTVYGSLNTSNLVDMKLDFIVKREAFGEDIQNILGILPGQERIKTVPASVTIKGPVGKTKVKLDLSQARNKIMAEIKRSTKEDLQKSFKRLGDELKKFFK
ncbi:MAG: AsmA family protein [Chlorobi bacterium]|nr:AsmA family protein [Chlorobiota bacterium]